MTSAVSARLPLAHVTEKPTHSVRLLQVFAFSLIVFPGNYIVKVVGADGYAAALVAYLMFIVWAAGTLLGHHNPYAYRYPTRITLALIWISTLASYAVMNRAVLSAIQTAGADRWIMQILGMSAVVLVTAEGLPTLEDVRRVLRVLTWGGAVCGIVAGLQYKAKIDLTKYLKLPGFGINTTTTTAEIVSRGTLNRVPGTGIDPIEMGVAMAMVLALAIYLLMHDKDRPKWQRVVPVICVAIGAGSSVSRSAVIAVAIAVGGLIISLPPARRLKGLSTFPMVLGVILVAAPGMIATLVGFFLGASTDPSVTHRTNNYPYVLQLVEQAPLLGTGGGTYIPAFDTHVLDDQYLDVAIELGLFGLAVFIIYLVCPVVAAFMARRRTTNPELRDLCAALGFAGVAAIVTSATFDSFGFPMFYNLQALIVGLVGAVWIIVRKEENNILANESEIKR
jgi:O-antigen ligase